MDEKTNRKLQSMVDREAVKIRRVNNGYVINSDKGMQIAATLDDVKKFLDEKFAKTVNK
jgi:hypothetical protein